MTECGVESISENSILGSTKALSLWLNSWKRDEIISFLLLVSLAIEHTPLPFKAQILPLTSIFALLFLPLIVRNFKLTPLFKITILFVSFVLVHSLFALLIDISVFNGGEIRILAWARQIIALTMGIAVFMILRTTLVRVSERFVIHSIILGATTAIFLAMLNILWDLSGNLIAGDIVIAIRSALGYSFISPARVSGLSQEPAHFAMYLSVIVFPSIFTAILTSKNRAFWFIFLCACFMSLIWTFSITGFVTFTGMLFCGVLFGQRKDIFAFLISALLPVAVGIFVLFENNYAASQIGSLLSSNWSLSITTRFYSAFGPFMRSFSSYTLLGYGLGGTSMHLADVVPDFARLDIASIHWKDMPTLGSLAGRLLAETGLIGLVLFGAIIILCFREIGLISQYSNERSEIVILKNIRLGIIAYLIGAGLFGPGSFALPYLWVWLSFVDARRQLYNSRKMGEC
ncbi:hypothetical protein [Methanothrix sp.]|uniref:hypothetical protein n=1 Tax=Methanothrix sp. TaxID=90426 RepID=UPI003C7337FC